MNRNECGMNVALPVTVLSSGARISLRITANTVQASHKFEAAKRVGEGALCLSP